MTKSEKLIRNVWVLFNKKHCNAFALAFVPIFRHQIVPLVISYHTFGLSNLLVKLPAYPTLGVFSETGFFF